MEHPKDVGDRSTLAIMLALRDCGYAVYVPFGEGRRGTRKGSACEQRISTRSRA
jgi:hypothetical protein